jgi:Lrp/AsnC family leucine-responsive transcriptional regulator
MRIRDTKDLKMKKKSNTVYSICNGNLNARSRIKKGLRINLDCEFCKGPITNNPHVFRFANFERFFCCIVCMSSYKLKYAGRIESIKRKYEGKDF